jgi:lipopolysaccharide biosynthesis glycosyltransferase
MIPLFCGFDNREAVGYHAFCASVIANTKDAVAFTPLQGWSDGTNAFTRARFLVPVLMKHKGWAIFADAADMICRSDIADLWAMRDQSKAVMVVCHDYKTKHPIKYVGTQMQSANSDYERKNWASLMLINCEHPTWADTVKLLETSTLDLLQFRHIPDEKIGALPKAWNWLVDEDGEYPGAKICHWTAGIPAWPHYSNAPMADEWHKYHNLANHASA